MLEVVNEIDLDPDLDDDLEAQEEQLHTMRPRSRPPEFNRLLRALVREMAEIYNNWRVAYAIDRTKRFFTEEELREDSSPAKVAFSRALAEFDRMRNDEQLQWQKRVIRRHPRLDRIVSDG
jgi:hypothetical protein